MRILVISDSHGNFPLIVEVCSQMEPFDVLFHLGDGHDDVDLLLKSGITECVHVAGNCDIGSTAPRELIWEYGGKKILLTHGDFYGVKSGRERLFRRAVECGVDAVLYGHTHLALHETRDGIVILNPGTLAAASAFHSCAVLTITPDSISADLFTLP